MPALKKIAALSVLLTSGVFASTILNSSSLGEPIQKTSALVLGSEIRKHALTVKAKYYQHSNQSFDYQAVKNSAEYQALIKLSKNLPHTDLTKLRTRAEKIAFWVNLYNALVIHGVIALELKKSLESRMTFFDEVSYTVSSLNFSLNDIEHGILRANVSKNDPRAIYALKKSETDPRIHFALNCGSQSCPPIVFLNPPELNQQLDLSAKNFIQNDTLVKNDVIYVSKIFEWYRDDFGPSLPKFLMKYTQQNTKLYLALKQGKPIKYKDYNWSLNGL